MRPERIEQYAREEAEVQQAIDNGFLCPECGSTYIEKGHADYDQNPTGLEVDWDECQECGHQWNIG